MATAISAMFFPTVRARPADCATALIQPPCVSSRSPDWKSGDTARTLSFSPRKEPKDERQDRTCLAGGRLLLGHAGPLAPLSWRYFDPGRLFGRRCEERYLSQPWQPCRGYRSHLRSSHDGFPHDPRILLPDPRSDDTEPPRQ